MPDRETPEMVTARERRNDDLNEPLRAAMEDAFFEEELTAPDGESLGYQWPRTDAILDRLAAPFIAALEAERERWEAEVNALTITQHEAELAVTEQRERAVRAEAERLTSDEARAVAAALRTMDEEPEISPMPVLVRCALVKLAALAGGEGDDE